MKHQYLANELLFALARMGAAPINTIQKLLPGKFSTELIQLTLHDMFAKGLVYRLRGRRWDATMKGLEQLDEMRRTALCTGNPRQWISNVRAGITADGRQTRITNAAIPKSMVSEELHYTPNFEEMIDLAREMQFDDD